jgi:hypothetical protein
MKNRKIRSIVSRLDLALYNKRLNKLEDADHKHLRAAGLLLAV